MKCSHEIQSEILKGKNEKLVSENNELKAWIREVELKNDALEKENEILRKCLKEVL